MKLKRTYIITLEATEDRGLAQGLLESIKDILAGAETARGEKPDSTYEIACMDLRGARPITFAVFMRGLTNAISILDAAKAIDDDGEPIPTDAEKKSAEALAAVAIARAMSN